MTGRQPLRVVVSAGCAVCGRARELAEAVRQQRPGQPVEVIDLDDRDAVAPPGVVGTPTFLIGKEIVAMGNPGLRLLLDTLDAVRIATWIAEQLGARIVELVGATRERTTTAPGEFAERRPVSLHRGRIRVRDRVRVAALADGATRTLTAGGRSGRSTDDDGGFPLS